MTNRHKNHENESIKQKEQLFVMAWEEGLRLAMFLQAMRAVLGELLFCGSVG